MASYLRPRRGKKSTAESQNLVLKRGEVFFECPDTGVGTGAGKLKVGDGSTAYASLPYFLGDTTEVADSTISFTNATAATDYDNNATYLANIKPANNLKTIFTNLKQLIYNYNDQLTQLDTDLIAPAANHNGIYRGKNLGTIASLAQWQAFRTAHGIDTHTYTDLYLGDYFVIQDGTYNKAWMVAGFDLYYNRGDNATARGVSLVPKVNLTTASMNGSHVTTNGFQGSAMHSTTLPAVVKALQNVLGSYLLPMHVLTSNTVNGSTASMAGAGYTGASTNWSWESVYATLMSEVQVYGSTILSSSFFDVGEACFQLPVYKFHSFVEFERSHFWLRAVVSSTVFASALGSGVAGYYSAGTSVGVRPLILVG